jgi:hypothetical protein
MNYIQKLFGNDPTASMSRLIAWSCVAHVLIMGTIHWSTLTQIQFDFLKMEFVGVIPYALGKIGDTIAAIKGPQ